MRTAVLMVALGMCLLACPQPARAGDKAGDKASAQKHFQTGLALMKAEDFAGASAEFETSVSLFPTKTGLFNLANCYKALHRYSKALDALEKLDEKFGEDLDDEMKGSVKRQENEIRALIADVEIAVKQTGAVIKVDGREVGASPLAEAVVVGPGEHAIEVSLDGYEAVSRKITLVSGAKAKESFDLEPSRVQLTVTAKPDGAVVTVDGKKQGETPLKEPLRLAPGKHTVRISRDGYADAEREVTLEPKENMALDLTLDEATQAAAVVPAAGPENKPAAGPATPSPPKAEQESGNKPSILFWTGLGLTAATGIAAGTFWILADTSYDSFTKSREDYRDGKIDADNSKLKNAKEFTDLYGKIALGTGIAAGALALGTAIVLVLDMTGEESGNAQASVVPGGVVVRF
ncbi:MAG: PEGA domain-containing protein [Deltaproteobacteria bacterium]|nr:PEGA domain-containing protein [Deltaproteobacteria bacterium]